MNESIQPIVVVARRLLDVGIEPLRERFEVRLGDLAISREELLALVPGAGAIVADPTVAIDSEVLDAAGPQLRVVANFAVGLDNLDLDACRKRGVAVTNTPGVLTNATAELALALTLAAGRLLGEAERELRAGGWRGWDPAAFRGLELSGATVGVVGMGRIGRRYAELLAGFEVELLYSGSTEKSVSGDHVGIEELLGRADVVSLHAPLTDVTRGMIGREAFALMKPTAVLVNTARGPLVDSEALAEALEAGRLGAAGLDVYEAEPEVPAVLLDAPRVVLLPHVGSATLRARDAMARMVADNVIAVLDGRDPPNRVV